MKIVFFGSSDFSIPVLKALVASNHSVVHVVTTPDKKKGRGQKLASTVVKEFALSHKLPVSAPEKLSDPSVSATMQKLDADMLVVASYGKLIPSSVFTIPKVAALNVHPSLLPKYRGASPIQQALLNGDQQTGVSIAEIIKELDAGDVFSQVTTHIDKDENALELSHRLGEMAGLLFLKVIQQFENGSVVRTPQDAAQSTYAAKLEKESGKIDWGKSAEQIHNQVRACFPWPSAFTFFRGKRLKICKSRVTATDSKAMKPGTIVEIIPADGVRVQAVPGTLEVLQVQLEGGREMSASEFARGQRIQKGEQLESL
ncbi:MAG: methionyl-tRNA formyltransferase [Omnitrophica bacterium RIFCSPHIGHO2_02_FULL_46_11]|nr:MAG: methionyl-tRNA formyltransferase [Omnitrophica bacterium RIFCSPLOWO2_01_FULL_45_10b]OGW87419.1 MAG: methionyl-tRNA formyltransferase [Omnitrophica bacterium RIFCSPHIGHO2_02_FULL_46_11]